MQTTFNEKPSAAFAGQLADGNLDGYFRSVLNEEASAIPWGLLVKIGSDDEGVALFSSGAKPAGVLRHSHAEALADNDDPGLQADDMGEVMRRGRIWVAVENAVTAGAQAYARHTSDGASNTQKGKFRSNADGVAQVTTVTPTAANSTLYSLDVFAGGRPFHFEVTSDGSATATEICDAFRTAMAANAAFTALVTTSGTATLILTGVTAGDAFYVSSGGSPGAYASITETTAASARAEAITGCRFLTSTSGAGLAILEVNLPA